VIACSSDTDCQYADLTYKNCDCNFKADGTGMCDVHQSNDAVYAAYWSDCGTSNVITDQDTAAYWSYYYLFYKITQSTVSCMSIFLEIQTLNDLYDAYNGAVALAVGVIGFLALH